jgi:hypothetical protein
MTRLTAVAVAAAVALLAAAALLVLSADHHPADAQPVARGSIPALKPVQVTHRRNGVWASYSKPGTSGEARPQAVPRARAAELRASFGVLSRTQTSAEHGDFDIQQFAQDVPTADLDGARALNAARTVWLIPTTDGQVCIGLKSTDGVTTFVHACGPVANAVTTGIAMTHGDGKLALLPDSASTAQVTAKGARKATSQAVTGNYVWLPDGGAVTFTDAAGTHTL